jgi:hypothetical protein
MRLGHWVGFSLLLIFNACNGSGSSGFDASSGGLQLEAAAKEQEVIDQITAEQGRCIQVEGTSFCSPTGELLSGGSVEVDDASSDPVPPTVRTITPSSRSTALCVEQPQPQGGCEITMTIKLSGPPAETAFIGAVRLQDSLSPWTTTDPFKPSSGNPSSLEAKVRLATIDGSAPARLQIAVLVYPPGKTVPAAASAEMLLRSFGAEKVFVVVEIAIDFVPSPS